MSIAAALRQRVQAAAANLVAEAAREAALMTAEASPAPMSGDLARSIRALSVNESGTTITCGIVAAAEHASYTDTGTGEFAGHDRIRGNPLLRFFWILGPKGPGVYYFHSVKGQPAQQWWITHHPERWPDALRLASARGAFSA